MKTREISFKSKELEAFMQQRGDLIVQGRELTDKLEKVEKDRNKVALQADKLTSKITPVLDKLVKPQLKDFEDVANIELKDGQIVVSIYDRVEDFKEQFLKAKEDAEKKKEESTKKGKEKKNPSK